MEEKMEKLDKWIKENGCPEYCEYCMYSDKCPQGMVCYGGQPIEPFCVGHEPDDFLDMDAIADMLRSNV